MPASDSDPERQTQRHTSTSLSSLLLANLSQFTADRVSLRDITQSLGHRSFGFILLLFALPNSLPIVGLPGLSTITGLPLLFVALQLMLGQERVYLPNWLGKRSLKRDSLQKIVTKLAPWLQKLERLLKPRLDLLTRGWAERLLGALAALLAFFLILPIPFGNLLPGLGILFIALGVIERDGLCVLIGLALAIASAFYLSGLVWVTLQALASMVEHFIGQP